MITIVEKSVKNYSKNGADQVTKPRKTNSKKSMFPHAFVTLKSMKTMGSE